MINRYHRNEIELMAPAGSWESFMAAIQGGANAVYVGVEKLNMRSKSSVNFTLADLPELSRLAKENGIRIYLALNTVLYDEDLELMREIIDKAGICGIDAIIASDQSVLQYANSRQMEVHLSTQLNISNIETVKFYAHFADVMVLARELNLEQVATISRSITEQQIKGPSGKLIRLELFIHGALCMAISGKCYLSLHQYNLSANRGECIQVCRRSYQVSERETGKELLVDNQYIMSPKDLCTVGFIDKILNAGVTVLKIEGRARSAEYVKTVVSTYSEAINAYVSGNYDAEHAAAWTSKLERVFNRGFWDGYYLGQELGEWSSVYGSKATRKKVYIGKVKNFFSRLSVVEIIIETGTLSTGDEIIFSGSATGIIETNVVEIRMDDAPVCEVKKGDLVSVPIEPGTLVRRSDKVYKWVDAELANRTE
jgi:U32 family peptidase